MEKYTTQMDAARRGIVTEQLKIVAQKEKMSVEELMPLVASGKVAICANKNHKCLNPEGVGSMLRTKINVNLGISRDCKDYDVEMKKVMAAVDMGAEAIMDLSSHGDTIPFRRKLVAECPAMIGTVPVYDSVIHYKRDLATLTAKDFIDVVRLHAQDGVDFVTLHCGITRHTIEQIKKHKRKMNIVSRGGSLVFAWMTMTGNENPFYEYYDEILDICREYDVTISLGDACRPGCLADASDVCQIEELVRLGELTKRAWAKDVQVMVEGPGHMPMDQIAANMKIQQTICMGAPFYVLGPLVTDIAPGYDHITSAIGGAIAAQNGAAFLCYVTPAEHLALPNVDDVKQGIIASKIAAHAADIAKGVKGAIDIDNKMAEARQKLDWEAQWECALDPETAKAIRDSRAPEHDDTCSMCGKFCAVRSMNKALAGEYIDIL
ncbi:MAG: phosphomethylpyrimidine synthase ThiC [Treponemataceae bacterium]|nr:phosphomethylpyrimidine synthase ThiC [Treponemataceae bacterium]